MYLQASHNYIMPYLVYMYVVTYIVAFLSHVLTGFTHITPHLMYVLTGFR